MPTTKLFLGLVLLFMGWLPFKNADSPSTQILKKNHILIRKVDKSKEVEQNSQMPGKEIYTDFCIQCHGANGKGDGKNFPPLDGSDWLRKKRKQSIYAVKFGQTGEIVVNNTTFNNTMLPMGLSNKEVADVMNYIMNSWSNKSGKKVTEAEVEKIIK